MNDSGNEVVETKRFSDYFGIEEIQGLQKLFSGNRTDGSDPGPSETGETDVNRLVSWFNAYIQETMPTVSPQDFGGFAGIMKTMIGETNLRINQRNACEESYAGIIESITDGVWDWNVVTGKVFFSRQWKSMLGFEEDEISDNLEEWSKRVHPEDLEETLELVNRHLRGETKVYKSEHRVICKDGSYKWILDEGKVVERDKDGQPLRAIGTHKDITDRKNIEKDLKKSEARYKEAQNLARLGHWEMDLVKNQLSWSEETFRIFGLDPEKDTIDYTVFLETIHPEDQDRVNDAYAMALKNREAYNITHRLLIKTGAIKYVNERCMTEYSDDGTPLRSLGTVMDVTDHIQAQQEILEREEKYRTLFETMRHGVVYQDKSGFITSANPEAERLLGLSLEQMQGRTSADPRWKAIHADGSDFPGEEHPAIEALRTGKEVRNTVMGVFNPCINDYVWLNIHAIPQFRPGETIPYQVFTMFEDITLQIQSESLLRESESLYRSIMLASPDNITITDFEGRVLMISPSAAEMFGYDQMDELIGKHINDFLVPEDIDRATENIGKMMQNIFTGPDEYRAFRKDGRVINIEANGDFIRTDDGRSTHLIFMIRDITERKSVEEKLRISEETYRKLVESINDVIYEITPAGILKFVSPSSKRVLGYAPDEVIGTNLLDYVVEADRPMIANAMKNLAMRDYTYLEYRYYTKEGKIRWVRSSTTAILDHGVVIAGTGSLTDITDRKEAEEELNKLSRAVEQSPVSIVITNLDGNIEYANPKACETTGYSLQELIGQNPRVLKSGETHSDEYQSLWNNITKGKEWKGVFHNKRKNGEYYWESSTISPIIGQDGEITHFLAVKEDITEKIQIENALRENEIRFRQIAEQSQTMIWETDRNGLVTYVSPVAESLLGYRIDEVVGIKHFYDLHPEDSREEFKEAALQIFKEKGCFSNLENRIQTRSGDIIWVSTNGAPVLDEEQNLLGYRGSDSDITERKLAVEKVKQQNERLNAIVQAIPDLLFVMDRQGYYHEFYSARPESLLVSEDRLIGMNMREIFDEETARMHMDHMLECLDLQKLVTYEYTFNSEPDVTYFEARLVPMNADRFIALIREITGKKKQEMELRKLSLAIEQSPVIIVITDLNAKIEYVNPAFLTTTGYTEEEVIGKHTRIQRSGETPMETYLEMWKAISTDHEWHGEWVNRKKSGELYWESISITPIHDESGLISNYLAVKQDITERKRADEKILELNQTLENKVKERTTQLADMNNSLVKEIEERIRIENALLISEKSYRNVVENVTEVIFRTDSEGNWIFLNKAWGDITGFSVEESLGQLFLNYVHPDDIYYNTEKFAPLINKEKDYCRHQVRYLTKDGGFRWIEVFARRGEDEQGTVTGTYGTLQDVTERKRSEDFESELLQLSIQLTGLPADEIPGAINTALSKIGYFLEADRIYIFELNSEMRTISNTYEWCYEGISSEIANLQDIPYEATPMWIAAMERQENIVISSVSDLPDSWSAERAALEPQGIKSLLSIPILSDNKLIGFIGLDSVRVQRNFGASEINDLTVWGNMIASLINYKRTEERIEQTRRNYETFFNTIDDFLFVLDEQGNIIHTNNTVRERLHFTHEELSGNSVLMVHPADRREEAGRIVGEMLAGTADFCPVPLVMSNGEQLPVETRVKHGYWDGRAAIFGVSKDISKIKLSEEKFSKAFHANASVMMISRIPDMNFLDVNDSFTKVFGYSREEALGKNPVDLDLVVEMEEWISKIEQLKQENQIREVEIKSRTKSGEIRIGLLSAEMIRIGNELSVLAVIVDITERKKAEEEILRARNEAEKANLAKSEFLSRMSHELRTPMNSILGFAQLMEMGDLNPTQRKGVNHIMNSGRHLLNLINEVLDIARIEAGRLSLSIEPVLLNTVISEMLDVVSPHADKLGQRLLFDKNNSTGWYLKADRQRLKQVLLNLISNAIKYNREGGNVRISTILVTDKPGGEDWCRILVKDTGIGIQENDIEKLFKPFERIGAEKTNTEGTGLGLPIVKKLMDAMGGVVGVESKVGEGSMFWIELPISAGYKLHKSPGMDKQDKRENQFMYSGTVLYVEDNIPNVELVEDIISAHRPGIRLINTTLGETAVNYAREYKPDLILLDLDLPDLNGSEVLKNLQTDESVSGIPVIIVSANAMPYQIKNLLDNGALEYLTKPLEIPEFLRILDSYLIVNRNN